MLRILLSFAFLGFCFSKNPCSQGPPYWCQNYDTATECGVLQFCKLQNNGVQEAKPVKVELFYESLCPGCRHFILTQLWPTYQALKDTDILDIKLYPYGNARERKNGEKWEFTCQHGPEECQVNLIETCALHQMSHPDQFMEYIHCIESDPSMANARQCADKLKIEFDPISSCYNGSQGNHLQHEVAEATDALNPPHKYVPWVLGNGVHNNEVEEAMLSDLLGWVCESYKGSKPVACNRPTREKCYKHDLETNEAK